MKKIIVGLFMSIFLILSGGGINYHFSLPVEPFDIFLLVVGIVILLATIAAAIIMRQELRQSLTLPMIVLSTIVFGALDACAMTVEQALTPPPVTPMIERSLVTGQEAWLYVLLAIVAWVVFYYGLVAFLRGCSWRNRPRCNYPQGQ